MSITDSAQPAVPLGKAPLKQPAKRQHHRIRRGQKLDEIVSLSELRLGQLASSSTSDASQSTFIPASSSSSASSAPAASSSNAAGDSPFQLQEYLAMLVRRDPHAVEAITSLPTEADIEALNADKVKSRDDSDDDGHFQNVDTDVWVYEQLRRLVLDLTTPWLTSLQQECDKHARPQTCAAMNAGDWMYLCASHGEEKQCCAIDYMVHTLDGATSLLNSARHFPSRTYVPNTSLRHFGSIARRLSRIFVHAWCYHKDVFLACEAETSLYSRFLVLVETYDLTATDNLPPRPGHEPPSSSASINAAEEFSRGASGAPFTLNGTTAKRERSGTAAMRSSLAHALQQSSPFHMPGRTEEGGGVGLVPPPAPSPRATAVLSRPEHEEGDDDAPACSGLAGKGTQSGGSFLPNEDDDDEDEGEEEEEEEEGGEAGDADDRTQKVSQSKAEDDATISLRNPDANGEGKEEEKEIIQAVAEATQSGETESST